MTVTIKIGEKFIINNEIALRNFLWLQSLICVQYLITVGL